ncbi:MAG TPA: hypothetical protein VGM15_07240 [Burkholderiaceae bacterium]
MTIAQKVLAGSLLSGALGLSLPLQADDDLPVIRPTVVVSVQASGNGPLHYSWRSSDGRIRDVDASSTKWTLPSGPGLHFAYVLVSDRKGGYSEARVAVNTDDLGGVPESFVSERRHLEAPSAPAQQADYYRGYVTLSSDSIGDIFGPGIGVFLTDTNNVRYPSTGSVATGADGSFVIAGVPAGASFSTTCLIEGGATALPCGGDVMLSTGTAFTQYDAFTNSPGFYPYVYGRVALGDGTTCGTNSELFGVHSVATATLLDASGTALASSQVDDFAGWVIRTQNHPTATQVRFRCEGAASITVPVTLPISPNPPYQVPTQKFAGTGVPVISGMTAPLNGNPGLFLPEPSKLPPASPPPTLGTNWTSFFPSDYVTRSADFLAFKGLDTRRGVCQYYKAIGAVRGCRSDGTLVGPISYEDWKRAVKIEAYAEEDGVKASASYVNKVDLNLTRVHESVRYGTDSLAAVVCNHLGPQVSVPADVLNPSQGSIDAAVDNAVKGKNLVACVAMDYGHRPGVNGDSKFVRFYIFGPSGQLLPSINLDGRGEKFVPGSCVPCHGGDHYAGRFPEDGSGYANFGGRFLPYDSGNFEFSAATGLTGPDQDEAIYQLNQNLVNVDPAAAVPAALTQAGRDLINGWYPSSMAPHTIDPDFIPQSWKTFISNDLPAHATVDSGFYRRVLARACRTCHVNQIAPYDFDHPENVIGQTDSSGFQTVAVGQTVVMLDTPNEFHRSTCGERSFSLDRSLTMPNSEVTFNRYWLSQGTTDQNAGPHVGESTDQPQLLSAFFTAQFGTPMFDLLYCGNPPVLSP